MQGQYNPPNATELYMTGAVCSQHFPEPCRSVNQEQYNPPNCSWKIGLCTWAYYRLPACCTVFSFTLYCVQFYTVLCSVLHCTVFSFTLYCVQFYAVLSSVLHCTVFSFTLCCVQFYTVLCSVLRCTALHCTILYSTEPSCSPVHCTALHCTLLNFLLV